MIGWAGKVLSLSSWPIEVPKHPVYLVRVKCSPDDTVGDLKKLIGAQKGTHPSKIVLKKW